MAERVPKAFLGVLSDLTGWLDSAHVPAMIVGGVAASILGRPRATPYEEEAIARGEFHDLGGLRVKLPQVEDLLIMKAIAQRPQDLRDIEGLLDVHPDANVARVHQWVREFATAMTMPDVLDGFEKLLAQRKSVRRR